MLVDCISKGICLKPFMPPMLSRYRRLASRRMPLWIFGILAIWWAGSVISYYQEDLDSELVGDSA